MMMLQSITSDFFYSCVLKGIWCYPKVQSTPVVASEAPNLVTKHLLENAYERMLTED